MQRIYDLAQGANGWSIFYKQMEEHDYPVLQRDYWFTEQPSFTLGKGRGTTIYHERNKNDQEVIFETGSVLIRLTIEKEEVRVAAAAADLESAQLLIEELQQVLPPIPDAEDGKRPVSFWTLGRFGPEHNTRRIVVPSWADVTGNYASSNDQLQQLMEYFPGSAGQLILWRGQPGTGKTWALRALIWEWRGWADFHYIVDPDKFFGQEASYLTNVLFHEDTQIPWRSPQDPGNRSPVQDRWKVLILEDCGEMISRDARERTGQGLSRLLNVVDGLIGQGLRVLVLVTTNEELHLLHEAVSRPGRCIANIEFKAFSDKEAAAWCDQHGIATKPVSFPQTMTLAELYALDSGVTVKHALVGFRG